MRVVLDTNVLSALMLATPDPRAVSWLDGSPPESIWTTSITVFEIRFGLEIISADAKKQRLREAFETTLQEDFSNRILNFDETATDEAALLSAEKRKIGRPIEIRDAMLCGIARARRAEIATRNVKHFEGSGVSIINPWDN